MKTLLALAAVAALALVPQALAVSSQPTGYQIVTEHSPSQNRVDRLNATPATPGYQIVTEHSPSQNRVDRLNATPVYTVSGGGFRWTDAGIGASAAVGALLLLLGAALIVLQRRRRLAF